MTFLHRTCQQAAALVLRRQDHALSWSERLALRVHLLLCRACPIFERQVRLMEEATGQWRRYVDRHDEELPRPPP